MQIALVAVFAAVIIGTIYNNYKKLKAKKKEEE